uniref:Large ribosomal subunit protein mL51 n=1 Tax=Geotrypetes seraphini TaxID=260995 RepID=A0A6P8PEU3_GEOSA|nr:39S ribosomal protein L51, mitochondrial [Geotrypetes seraphini]XP_033779686.1 39S ribosomal protein L51, mitochondrial [Geotrypetes seraphini]
MASVLQRLGPCLSLMSSLVHSQRTFSLGVVNLIRMTTVHKPTKQVDRWTEKRALFGVFDNVGILGDFKTHPKNLIKGPKWLLGWKGNELQRCIRKKKFVGHRMFLEDLEKLNKRIRFLYKRFNRTGKHR